MSVAGTSSRVDPAHLCVPEHVDTLGAEVADLAALAGFGPDAEQRLVLDGIFAWADGGLSAAFETAVVAPRQNLKTGVFKQAALGWLFLTDERLVVWSAHEFRTAQEAFRDLEALVTNSDWLRRRVKHIYRGNGDESIETTRGARLIFKTRTRGGGRGLSGRKVILDEAFALRSMHLGALLPTLSAQPDPQVLYGSSAGLVDSEVMRGVRDRGRGGSDPRLAWYEWCAPPPEQACRLGDRCSHGLDVDGCGCDDPELWGRANPAMGSRITADYIAAERRALPPAEFARERMGWWDDPGASSAVFPLAAFLDAADSSSRAEHPVAFALDITPDRSAASIAAAGRRADGRSYGELVDHLPGTDWIGARLAQLADRWDPCVLVLDPSGPAGALVAGLAEAGWVESPGPSERRLMLVNAREMAQACGALVDDVVNDRWRRSAEPDQLPLVTAAEGVRIRQLADAYAWSRRDSSVDISPLVAVTLARHGHATWGVRPAPSPLIAWVANS